MQQAHLNFMKFVLAKGLHLSVWHSEGDMEAPEYTGDSYQKAKDEVDAVEWSNVQAVDPESGEVLGTIAIIFDYDQPPEETVNDYTITPLTQEWEKQYYK